ncbi:uncharacterized protein [Channa argus]|uniref:uncharacterized protein isoform X6 n=1 Tax=Channa argus TaxID=215402 RepID=UPI00352223E3
MEARLDSSGGTAGKPCSVSPWTLVKASYRATGALSFPGYLSSLQKEAAGVKLLHHEVIISDSYTGNSAPPVFIISSSSSSAVSAKSRAASRVSASSSSSSSPSPCSDNSSARLSLSSPELLSELKQSRTRSLRHVRTHSGLTTIFSGRGRRGGEQHLHKMSST